MYSWRGLGRIDEVVRIPLIEYLLVAVLALLIWAGVRLAGLFRS